MDSQYKLKSGVSKLKSSADHEVYLSKRVLLRSIHRQSPLLINSAMSIKGYVMTAENGYVVKLKADGTRENVSKLNVVKRPSRIVLD